MDFRIDFFLHMTWEDPRLNITIIEKEMLKHHLALQPYAIDYLWTPDPYITKSKVADITSLTKQYASLTLFTNSSLRYSARVFSVIGCQMEFHHYPRDIQNCSMKLQSFMYGADEVIFVWRNWSPVEINPNLKLNQFSLEQPMQFYSTNVFGPEKTRKDSRALVVIFEFHREIGHHLVQTYVPSFLLVALSWFSFWMGLDAIPGRVTLVVTSLLTLTTLFTGIQDNLPPVAYIKAIDVWMGGCMVFIFAALGEFIIVKVIKQMEQKLKEQQQQKISSMPPKMTNRVEKSTLNNGTLNVIDVNPYVRNQNKSIENKDGIYGSNKLFYGPARQPMDRQRNNSSSTIVEMWDTEIGSTHLTSSESVKMQGTYSPKARSRCMSLTWLSETGKDKSLWEEIDRASRIIFPLMFLLFMVFYFPLLWSRSF